SDPVGRGGGRPNGQTRPCSQQKRRRPKRPRPKRPPKLRSTLPPPKRRRRSNRVLLTCRPIRLLRAARAPDGARSAGLIVTWRPYIATVDRVHRAAGTPFREHAGR